ncbi:MAG: NAD+ synthase [Rhodanobacteraceae bacterium]|jgi:NH3-dependent NAD+ synthetase/predicted amidohydrolase|nr:NAD+ synthase [Rhodanobacteraceae bacterium]
MTLRIALAQFDFPVGAVARNEARIAELIAQARDVHRADLVLFPELTLSGYPPEDLLLRPSFLAECAQALQRLAAQTQGITAVVGWPEAAGAIVYNAASVLRDGRVVATCRKRELPNYAVFDERRYFEVDPDAGACVVEVAGVQVGLVICEDLWFAEPAAATARAGAQLLLVPNASPFERDKHAQRDALLAARVAETGLAVAYLNLVGGQDALVFDGASVLADGDGHVHPAARACEEHWLVADFDAATRRFTPLLWPAEEDEGRDALAWRAIVRGTRDYCVKNGFRQAWIGLSGGIDSAVVLALAVDALGADNVTGVRLPSRYTTDLSNDLAEEQARALGVRLLTVPIEAPFAGFMDALAPAFAGRAADVTEENLQSRCRGTLMMALANKFGGLVLTTGNKSEYAVGYATIYGDMCGGYAPIKDLYKTEVYALAKWRNGRDSDCAGGRRSEHSRSEWPEGRAAGGGESLGIGDSERRPLPIPNAVIERAPSAELRENQTDQDSLPPYEVLDAILLRYVDQEQSREDIVGAGFDAATVDRVLQLVRVNEWKRHQAAPGPKVSRRAFGRERRYPITSGWR